MMDRNHDKLTDSGAYEKFSFPDFEYFRLKNTDLYLNEINELPVN